MSGAPVITPPPKPESATSLFLWLWRDYLYKHKLLLGFAVVLMAIEGSMLAVLSRLVQPMFDDVFDEGSIDAMYMVGFGVMMIFFIRAATSAAQRVLLTVIRQRAAADMQRAMLSHLMALDTSFYQENSPGELISRMQGDTGSINKVWSTILTAVSRDLVSLIGLIGVALWIDWTWTLIALVGVPLLAAPSVIVQGFIRGRAALAREIAARMSTRLDEVFHGINPIKLNSLETYQSDRQNDLIKQRMDASIRLSLWQAAVPAMIDIMTGIGFLGVLIYGGSEIIAGEKTNGEFMAFFTAISLAFDPIRRLGALSGTWQVAAASVERLRWVLTTEPTIVSPENPVPAPTTAPEIELRDVTLHYDDLPVLRGTSFIAEAGKTTALVGASGAGKSTVFNVLTRLVEPSSGTVTVDGKGIATLDLKALRGLFSVVSQDAALFDESLRENILLGREDVDDAYLDQVLEAAHVADFLPNLSKGLDSPTGPRGSSLSGGQRQRVAIARALLRNTPVLLLDEATSALDTKSEVIVQTALEKLSHGRTTLVIAHRLSTIRNADKIIVMDQGRVVDQGTHDDLLERGGLYADLYNMQFKQDQDNANA